MKSQEIVSKIQQLIPDAKVTLKDLTGTGDHWSAVVVSRQFKGMSQIKRHRLVYSALEEEMGGAIHALSLDTRVSMEE